MGSYNIISVMQIRAFATHTHKYLSRSWLLVLIIFLHFSCERSPFVLTCITASPWESFGPDMQVKSYECKRSCIIFVFHFLTRLACTSHKLIMSYLYSFNKIIYSTKRPSEDDSTGCHWICWTHI